MRYIVQCGRGNRQYVDAMYEEIPNLEEMHDDKETLAYADKMNCTVPMAGFMDCMKVYESHIHLEDDVILCKGFKNKIENIIAQAPHIPMRLFSRPMDKDGGWSTKKGWNQCLYLPEWALRGIVHHFETVWWQNEYNRLNDKNAFDYVIHDYLMSVGQKMWVAVPSLVEHAEGSSSLGSRPRIRKAGIFIDDMEDPDSVTWEIQL